MATLKVPTPTFPPFIEIPAHEESAEEEVEKENTEIKVESQSQSNYAMSVLSCYAIRRKSV